MAQEGYWEDQFVQALPVFLANWYAENYLSAVVQSCEREGITSLLKSTGGLYKTDAVGLWIVNHTNAVKTILDHLKTNDPIHKALLSKISYSHLIGQSKTKGQRFSLDSYPKELQDALCHALGKRIQETDWWKNNIADIKKEARQIRAVQKVMEC